jgi:hypothetical protein
MKKKEILSRHLYSERLPCPFLCKFKKLQDPTVDGLRYRRPTRCTCNVGDISLYYALSRRASVSPPLQHTVPALHVIGRPHPMVTHHNIWNLKQV